VHAHGTVILEEQLIPCRRRFPELTQKFHVFYRTRGHCLHSQEPANAYYFKSNTGWHTKCHTIDCACNTFLLLQKRLTSGTELILIGWKIVPKEEHVQYDHHFASQPLANEPLHSSQLFNTSLQKAHGTTSLYGP